MPMYTHGIRLTKNFHERPPRREAGSMQQMYNHGPSHGSPHYGKRGPCNKCIITALPMDPPTKGSGSMQQMYNHGPSHGSPWIRGCMVIKQSIT